MLNVRKSFATAVLLFSLMPLKSFADSDAFKIANIKLAGLTRLTPATVLHYIPVHKGDMLTDQNSVQVIQDLYNTGFFSDVQLNRTGNTLWVILKERPTITSISFSGNSAVTNKQLLKALKTNGIIEGAFFDSSKMHGIVEGLKQLYASTGHNNAIINAKLTHASRNRVGLNILINEGGVAKVSSVRFVGAKAFSSSELSRQLKMHPTNILEFMSSANKFSQMGMDNNKEALTNFYLDHGYLNFQVTKADTKMSADKKHVAIVYYVNEGMPYTISSIHVDNHSNMPTRKIDALMKIKVGQLFSRSKIMDTNTAVGNAFANEGYAFPNVTMQPHINPVNHTVDITFVVAPGKHITVRYINFAGNNMTEDQTLRHELTFMEGSPYAQSRLDESKRRFYNLPFIANVKETTTPVPGTKNQVDINYNVAEVESGRAQIMAGYSDTEHFLYGISLTEPNFKGEGKNVGINLTRSELSDSVSFNYFNPFYSIHNIGRGFELHYTNTNPKSQLNIASYDLDGYGASLNYTIPMSQYLTFNYSFGLDRQQVKTTAYTPLSIQYFVNPSKVGLNGSGSLPVGTASPVYNNTSVTAGLTFSNTDRYYFPTSGSNSSLNLTSGIPLIHPNLSYYSANLKATWYHPLSHNRNWVLVLHTNDSYGQGYGDTKYFPFMDNFYSGGISTVPGFSSNSLGPTDKWGNALGGNESIAYGFDVVFPNPIGKSLRTSITFNGGNVYNSFISSHPNLNKNDPAKTCTGKDAKGHCDAYSYSGPIRYSVGLRIQWQMPMLGLIQFAIAKPLNAQKRDQTTWFNFTFGTQF